MLWTVEEDKEEDNKEKEDYDDELPKERNGDCGGGGNKFEAKCRRASCHVHIVLPKSRAGLSDPAWRGLFEVG